MSSISILQFGNLYFAKENKTAVFNVFVVNVNYVNVNVNVNVFNTYFNYKRPVAAGWLRTIHFINISH